MDVVRLAIADHENVLKKLVMNIHLSANITKIVLPKLKQNAVVHTNVFVINLNVAILDKLFAPPDTQDKSLISMNVVQLLDVFHQPLHQLSSQL